MYNPEATINIGDPEQLRPFSANRYTTGMTPYADQVATSDFQRRKELGWPGIVMLEEQHRATSGLMWYSSKMCYGDKLLNGMGTDLYDEKRRHSREFIDFHEVSPLFILISAFE